VKFLSNMAEADAEGQAMSYVGAVAHQEQLTFLYNKGNTTGDPTVNGTVPKVPLVPMLPKDGTLMLDHPYVVLPSASQAQKEAAADFLAFLQKPEQQARFAAMGFRDHQGNAGPELRQTLGIPQGQKLSIIQPPAGEILDKILDGWDDLRKKARVLLVLDTSGSMRENAVDGLSKLEAAKNAAIASLDLLHPDDEVALWTFSGARPGGGEPYTERMPMSRIRRREETAHHDHPGAERRRRHRAVPHHPRGGSVHAPTVGRRPHQRGRAAHRRPQRVPGRQRQGETAPRPRRVGAGELRPHLRYRVR
jgi:Ca-activated chloride channel family protein